MVRVTAKSLIEGAKNNKNIQQLFSQSSSSSQNQNNMTPTPVKHSRKRVAASPLDDIDESEPSLKDVCRGLSAINQKLTYMQQSIENNNHLIATTSQRSVHNEKRINGIAQSNQFLHQNRLNDRMEITNFSPTTFNMATDIKPQVIAFLRSMQIDVEPVEVANAFVMRKKTAQGERVSIIVVFIHEAIKSRVMKRKFSMKSGSANNCYFNDVLTPSNRKIMFEARRMKKEGKFAVAGTLNGQIYVKKSSDGEKIFINSLCELEELGNMKAVNIANENVSSLSNE